MAEAQADPDHGIMPHTGRLLVGKSVGLVALIAMLCAGIGGATSRSEAAASTLNVRTYGAVGDGRHDDTTALVRATRAAVAKHATLLVPRGTYRLSSISLPDGLTMRGVGRGSWLKGEVVFGSRSSISGLKLGDAGKSTHNRAGASTTTFTACRFRGGGGSEFNAPVIMLGLSQNSCDHITFTDCNVERNLSPSSSGGSNNVSITATRGSGGATVDYITFTGCHFGVSNGSGGHDTGSPIANIECTTPGTSDTYHNGFSHITVDGCVFEISDWFSLDFSCGRISGTTTLSAHDIIVTDSLFKGAGYTGSYGYDLCLELPYNVLVSGNTFWRSSRQALKFAHHSANTDGSNTVITGNTFQLDYDNGITHTGDAFYFVGNDIEFTNNTIVNNQGDLLWNFWGAHNSTCTGNTVEDLRSSGAPMYYQFVDTTGTVMTGNTFTTHTGSDPTHNISTGNSGNTYSPNTLIHD